MDLIDVARILNRVALLGVVAFCVAIVAAGTKRWLLARTSGLVAIASSAPAFLASSSVVLCVRFAPGWIFYKGDELSRETIQYLADALTSSWLPAIVGPFFLAGASGLLAAYASRRLTQIRAA